MRPRSFLLWGPFRVVAGGLWGSPCQIDGEGVFEHREEGRGLSGAC